MSNKFYKFGSAVFRESTLIDAPELNTEDYTPNFIVSGDFNGDNLADLFLTSLDWKIQGAGGAKTPAWLFVQTQKGTWEIIDIDGLNDEEVAQWPSRNVVADLNNDGIDEIIIVETGPHRPEPGEDWGGYNKLVGFNKVNSLIENQTYKIPEIKLYSHWISVGDLNSDGLPDLIVNDRTTMGTRLWQATPEGNFTDIEDFNFIFGSYETTSSSGNTYQTPERHLSSLVIDLDLDGSMDLVVGQDHRGTGSRVYWNTNGELEEDLYSTLPLGNYQSVFGAVSISSINLNDDIYPDLIISNVPENYRDSRIQLLLNNGDRTFTDATFDYLQNDALSAKGISLLTESNYGSPWIIAFKSIDLNNDGINETFIKTEGEGFGVLFSDTIGSTLDTLFLRDTSAAEVADIDSDGDIDIVLSRLDSFQGTNASIKFLENITVEGQRVSGTTDIDLLYTSSFDSISLTETGSYIVDDFQINGIERLISPTKKLALDLDGNAGDVVKILAAIIGPESAFNPQYVGIGLELLDSGFSLSDVFALALSAVGADTAEKQISLLWENLFGEAPSNSTLTQYTLALLSGQISDTDLAIAATDAVSELGLVDLVGLQSTGLEFL